ncbi:recombinase family protein [Rubinisphaera margarita]|uniref:recombinase family protein n=1 Tax=Rubinisphaera margarita TaxID=2909586 RepID=UPI001EE8C41B|nr:recombinase family protein [Rubinisphaera margarita]MCG6158325.1 recombinase family protein [Rubinisphaera margarita]
MPRRRTTPEKTTPQVRCAIYTRKSTEEGLEQEFNSLDAQREAGEAYITSQRGEGWVCLPTHYDDGGFTGGNMERPALKRLLDDIEAGEVDCVVVYKVDRLSRSLKDFTRVMEVFERHNVSFVSVTQAFNTTSSMGRLTLNILLSFAQFEREIISERTRDKMAAARRKGRYLGGPPLLGYDIDREKSRLVVNDREAAKVRKIFELYLEKGSLLATIAELDQRGWNTKSYTTRKGEPRGGTPFNKARLHALLTNVVYVGKVKYKDELHEGQHEAIANADTFRQVQSQLLRNRVTGNPRTKTTALLQGLLYCEPCGCSMTQSYTTKQRSKRYRYYVCTNAQKRGWHDCPSKSIPAGQIEEYVVDHVRGMGQDEGLIEQTIAAVRAEQAMTRATATEQKKKLTTELTNADRELERLSRNPATLVPAELAAVQDRIQRIEARLREAERQLYEGPIISDDQIRTALRQFDQVWDSLSLKDRSRILQLLIERVEYDGAESTVSIHFHTNGIESLIAELPEGATA